VVPKRTRDAALILVVDDNEDARDLYCTYLRHEGFDCVEAADGNAALTLARQRVPALILMDATMPGRDGWETTAAIRADDTLKHVPVLMVTAQAYEEHRLRAREVGADGFLPKPVLPDALANAVRRTLRGLA
jgi:DNA-binding response OmpR family regulator